MIPKILHQAWLGKEMPKNVQAWVASMGRHHAGWSHIIWTEPMLNEVLEMKPRKLFEELGSWAAATNIIRLHLLVKFGGVWADTDFEAHDSLDRLPMDEWTAFAAEQDGGRVCNALLGAERGHQWIRDQVMRCFRPEYPANDPAVGVYIATDVPRTGVTIIPQHYVFPYLYDSPPEKRVIHKDTILEHKWEGSWLK